VSDDRLTHEEWVHRSLGSNSPFRRSAATEEQPEVKEMRKNRRVNQKLAQGSSMRGGTNLEFATGRPRDPLFYWRQNNLPYDFAEPDELAKIRNFTRLIYQTDPIIGSCVDIYAKLPLLGMELSCKDEKLVEFHTNLFGFGEEADDGSLDYEDFLIDVGREYWSVGEVWPFATFNETLGVWEDEELLNPDDIRVERSPFLKEPRFFIRLPETIRRVLETRQPHWEYAKLVQAYPELVAYTNENQFMPVSNVLLRQLKFKGDTFNSRGVPLLTRAMRSVMQQEMLNAAMDSIADRLYTPLILVKLGASASDLGTTQPWIPTDDDRADFEEALDSALAADFRALIYSFAVEIEPVFGREQMPDLSPDFERLEDRILQTFGLSRTLLTGASAGETYAADALNRDLISQLLTTYQKLIKRHYRQRALVVAEAQEHFDYDLRLGKRYVKMEEVLEVDEETGESRIIEQPKLLIPSLHMKTMNLRDEDQERTFIEALRASGMPISMRTRIRNLPIDLDDEVESSRDEAIQLAVGEQETRKGIYIALRDQGLPIPEDLETDFGAKAVQAQQAAAMEQQAAEQVRVPMMGLDPTGVGTPNMAPTEQDLQDDPADTNDAASMQPSPMAQVIPMAMPAQSQHVSESDEQREGMPKPAALFRQAARMRDLVSEDRDKAEAERQRILAYQETHDGNLPEFDQTEPRGKWAAPRHIGRRRYLDINTDEPMQEMYTGSE
jgi:hypothetical protein